MSSKVVVIIGAGIGGLATAVRLLSCGYKVVIYEKEDRIGGKVNLLEAGEFRFDLTASILMMPQSIKELFESVGRDYRDYLEFIRLDPVYRAFYEEGGSIDFSSDMVKLTNNLEEISKTDSAGYIEFLGDVYKKYLIADKYFLSKPYRKPGDFFNRASILNALRMRTLSTSYRRISKFVKDERIRKYLAYQALYVGISPFDGPNIYNLVPVTSQLYGLWHLKGGMYSLISALGKLIREMGGEIKTGIKVEKILIPEGKAYGVITAAGEERGDVIICNADFPYAIKELVGDRAARGKYDDRKLGRMAYSCSNFIIYLGLKKRHPQLSVHNLFLGEDFKEGIEAAFTGKLPEKPSFYMYCPSRIDEDMCSMGKEVLSIVVRVPNLFSGNIDWEGKGMKIIRDRVMKQVKSIRGLEDIEDNIAYEGYLTPKDLERNFNSYGGTSYGLSPTLTQTNYFRPHIKSESVKNLYFVGSSVHPGAGVSIVIKSSKLAADEVLRDKE